MDLNKKEKEIIYCALKSLSSSELIDTEGVYYDLSPEALSTIQDIKVKLLGDATNLLDKLVEAHYEK